jgi:hypothetical protein
LEFPVRPSRILIILASALVIASTNVGICQDNQLDLLLSKDQQSKLGVATMRPDQRELLRQVLTNSYRQGYETGKRGGSLPSTQTPLPQPTQVIESRVDGDFIGWEGHTVVKLTNGQIWQQIEFHYVRRFASRPNARIYHSNAGYKMIVEGIDDVAVGVERTK